LFLVNSRDLILKMNHQLDIATRENQHILIISSKMKEKDLFFYNKAVINL